MTPIIINLNMQLCIDTESGTVSVNATGDVEKSDSTGVAPATEAVKEAVAEVVEKVVEDVTEQVDNIPEPPTPPAMPEPKTKEEVAPPPPPPPSEVFGVCPPPPKLEPIEIEDDSEIVMSPEEEAVLDNMPPPPPIIPNADAPMVAGSVADFDKPLPEMEEARRKAQERIAKETSLPPVPPPVDKPSVDQRKSAQPPQVVEGDVLETTAAPIALMENQVWDADTRFKAAMGISPNDPMPPEYAALTDTQRFNMMLGYGANEQVPLPSEDVYGKGCDEYSYPTSIYRSLSLEIDLYRTAIWCPKVQQVPTPVVENPDDLHPVQPADGSKRTMADARQLPVFNRSQHPNSALWSTAPVPPPKKGMEDEIFYWDIKTGERLPGVVIAEMPPLSSNIRIRDTRMDRLLQAVDAFTSDQTWVDEDASEDFAPVSADNYLTDYV